MAPPRIPSGRRVAGRLRARNVDTRVSSRPGAIETRDPSLAEVAS